MSLIDKIIDAATSKPARGIVTGYVQAKVNDTAAQDKLNQEFILAAKDQYYNVDKPQFVADEKKRSANIKFIATELSPVYANYADANDYTLSDVNTRAFVDKIGDLSNEDQYKLESTIASRKKERVLSFDDKNKFIQDQFLKMKGAPGDINMMKVFFPNEGQDIAQVGINQLDQTTEATEPMKSIMEIEGTGKTFDFNNLNHRAAAGDVESRFNRFFQDPENFDVYDFSANPELTKDYKEYQDAGFKGSQVEFAFQKFMEINLNTPEFGELKYTGGYRAFDDKVIANRKSKQTKAVVGDNKKFDQTGSDKDFPDINIKDDKDAKVDSIKFKGPGIKVTGESSAIMREAREAKSAIINDPNLSETEKEKRINTLTQSVRKDLAEAGVNPDDFKI